MDLYRIIDDLTTERDRIVRIIESLELMVYDPATSRPAAKRGRKPGVAAKKTAARRGRPPMNAAERAAQAARMKEYWAKRRAEKNGAAESPAEA